MKLRFTQVPNGPRLILVRLAVPQSVVVVGYDVVEVGYFDGRIVFLVEPHPFVRQLPIEVILVFDDPDLDLIAFLVPDLELLSVGLGGGGTYEKNM